MRRRARDFGVICWKFGKNNKGRKPVNEGARERGRVMSANFGFLVDVFVLSCESWTLGSSRDICHKILCSNSDPFVF